MARRARGRAARRRDRGREVDAELASRIRASFLLAGPLLARVGEAHMPPPGGDFIGRRRLDPHLDALRALGAQIEVDGDYTMWAPDGLRACDFFMDEASVMATENALMAAALTPGHDHDPQRRLGAARAGPRAAARLDGRADRRHRLEHPDGARPDGSAAPSTRSRRTTSRSASFMALAAVTGGELRIKDTDPRGSRR